ncbi:hypothetical protein CCO03_19020 [Comamonas serinivorans]|uniref:O-antigen ligase-related domain-containing protein n=1 Tax=Comamonas serinivorans TaxID=1082851 RepID=A0A1Y0ETV1_9BURK|nr:O-antigen ligase family protein [Comamonas serinivorans]ARU06988.1 hypothetical protein CCO03_19020 [Comamonas serinivorans]
MSRSVLQRGVNVAAFLVPGFALWLPSGYSYGALALLLLAILSLPQWLGKPVPRHTVGLALAITLMALVLLLDFDPSSGSLKALDRPIKYLAALPCLLMLAQWAPTCKAVWRGVAVGAWGAGCVGAWQVWGQGLERAAGHTNEIQYGNLALCLGVMCLIGLVCLWARWRPTERWALAGGVFMGLMASVLSQSRGGWLALLLLAPVLLWLALRWLPTVRVWRASGALLLAVLLLGGAFHDNLRQRTALAMEEVNAYVDTGEAHTSIGQRLAHWQLAWRLGTERPVWGWGSEGYEREKRSRAEHGEVSAFVTQFSHAHNELLDTFARRGGVGVLALLLFYGVPLAVFWPSRRRLERLATPEAREQDLAVRLVGVCLVLSYIGFGFTQVFFAHNSGNLFYLFMLAILSAMLVTPGAARSQA